MYYQYAPAYKRYLEILSGMYKYKYCLDWYVNCVEQRSAVQLMIKLFIIIYLIWYLLCYCRFGKNARIIHFIGPLKPWHHTYLPESDNVIPIPNSAYQHSPEHLQRWWRAYQATQVSVCLSVCLFVHVYSVCMIVSHIYVLCSVIMKPYCIVCMYYGLVD